MKKILITGSGSEIAYSIIQSLDGSNLDIAIIGVDADPFNASICKCDKFHIIPPVTSSNYIKELIYICKKESIDLIIPSINQKIHATPFFFKQLEQANLSNTTVLTSNLSLIDLCHNRQKIHDFFIDQKLPFTDTVKFNSIEDLLLKTDFPIIAKPIDKTNSGNLIFISNKNDINKIPNKENYIFQKYIYGISQSRLIENEILSAQILIGQNKELLGTTLYHTSPNKIIPFKDTYIDDIVLDIGHRLAEKGLLGPCHLKGKMTSKGPLFFEVNLGFSAISSAFTDLNFKECEALIENILFHKQKKDLRPILSPNYDAVAFRSHTNLIVAKNKFTRF